MDERADLLDLTGPEAPKYTESEHRTLNTALTALQRRVIHGEFSARAIDRSLLCELHRAFFEKVRDHAGRCRMPGLGSQYLVFGPNRSVHCSEVLDRLDALFPKIVPTLRSLEATREDAQYEEMGLRAAVWTHAEIVRIHPFEDGNGRMSRLVMDVFLVRIGLRAIPVEVPRTEYYAVLNHYFKTGDLEPAVDLYLQLAAGRLPPRYRTGAKAPIAGRYHGACQCRVVIALASGAPFPSCPSCSHEVGWFLFRT